MKISFVRGGADCYVFYILILTIKKKYTSFVLKCTKIKYITNHQSKNLSDISRFIAIIIKYKQKTKSSFYILTDVAVQ